MIIQPQTTIDNFSDDALHLRVALRAQLRILLPLRNQNPSHYRPVIRDHLRLLRAFMPAVISPTERIAKRLHQAA